MSGDERAFLFRVFFFFLAYYFFYLLLLFSWLFSFLTLIHTFAHIHTQTMFTFRVVGLSRAFDLNVGHIVW